MQQQQPTKSCSSENAAEAFAILVSHYCDRNIFTRYPNITYNKKKEKGCAARVLLNVTGHKRGFPLAKRFKMESSVSSLVKETGEKPSTSGEIDAPGFESLEDQGNRATRGISSEE